jgi:hypothetical protein
MQDAGVQDEEAVRVFHWRVRRFLDLGFTLRQARTLAGGEAEWHNAEKLLGRGCSRETAFDLLS